MQLALLFLLLLMTGPALVEAEWEEDEEYEEEEDDSQFAEVIVETDTALIWFSFKQKINFLYLFGLPPITSIVGYSNYKFIF